MSQDGATHRPSTAELMRMLAAQHVDKVPRGWYTSNQIRDAAKISTGYVNRFILGLRERGIISEIRQFKVSHFARSATPVPHYRIDDANAADLGLIPPPSSQ